MKTACFLAVSSMLATFLHAQATSQIGVQTRQELEEIARVGSVMVDGDICQKIVTPHAKETMFAVDPRDQFIAGDNYDVDAASFNTTKKGLIRLSHLADFPADVNLWMPIEGHPDKVQMVINNKNQMSQFWPWGTLYQDMVPQMANVLKTGKRLTVTEKPGWISVLAPVYNSLGDIVALIEVASRAQVDPHADVK